MSAATPLRHAPRRWRAPSAVRVTLAVVPLLVVGAWAYILLHEPDSVGALFSARSWREARDVIGAALGFQTALTPDGVERPFLDGGRWWELAVLAYETLAMSVLAIWLAGAGMLATVSLGARPSGGGAGAARPARYALFVAVRALWVFARSVPELVWALLLVFLLPPGLLTGALALAVHNFGVVGKLCSEVIEDLDPRPARALRGAGAGGMQTLLYATLPQALPRFLTYSLYRWEVIIRTTIVVSFVTAGGLGGEFRLAMSFFRYTDVAMVLVTYFVLVVLVDLVAAQLRRLAA